MPATTRRPRRLTDAELDQMLALTKEADSSERGVDLGGKQQTKTKTALEYFSRHLEAEAAAAAKA
jgi:hypothetical protein